MNRGYGWWRVIGLFSIISTRSISDSSVSSFMHLTQKVPLRSLPVSSPLCEHPDAHSNGNKNAEDVRRTYKQSAIFA